MQKYLLTILSLLQVFCFISAQTTIAVIDFNARGISANEVATLTDRFRDELIKSGKYNVIERGQMEEVLKEQGFQQSGCVSDECVVEVGQLIGVQQMVGGSIGKVGNVFSVSARIILVQTGEILNVITYDHTGDISSLLTSGIKEFVSRLSAEQLKIDAQEDVGIGTLYITTDPTGAEVWVDDLKIAGLTPLIVDGQTSGKHSIFVQKNDYSATSLVNVITDDMVKVHINLELGFGRLKVITDPFEAEVYLDGVKKGQSPIVLKNIVSGLHKLSIHKGGYAQFDQQIRINSNQLNERSITLEKLSKVRINSNISGASVVIGGISKGTAPINLDLIAGDHEIVIQKTGYYEEIKSISVLPGQKTEVDFNLILVPTLEIATTPTNATVFLDSINIGVTPINVEIDAGLHNLTLVSAGFNAYVEDIEIIAEDKKIIDIDLISLPIIKITSTPSTADVLINDKQVGNTPFEQKFSAGTYNLKITCPGFYDETSIIVVQPKTDQELDFILNAYKGSISIVSDPDSADIFIDNLYYGVSPLDIDNLSIGQYDIRIEKEGFHLYNSSVTINRDEEKEIDIKLIEKISFSAQDFLPINKDDYYWLGASTVGILLGGYFQYSANNNYEQYQTDMNNAADLHQTIELKDKLSIGLFTAGVMCIGKYTYDKIQEKMASK